MADNDTKGYQEKLQSTKLGNLYSHINHHTTGDVICQTTPVKSNENLSKTDKQQRSNYNQIEQSSQPYQSTHHWRSCIPIHTSKSNKNLIETNAQPWRNYYQIRQLSQPYQSKQCWRCRNVVYLPPPVSLIKTPAKHNIEEISTKFSNFLSHINLHTAGDVVYLSTPISPIRTPAKWTEQARPSINLQKKQRNMNNQG